MSSKRIVHRPSGLESYLEAHESDVEADVIFALEEQFEGPRRRSAEPENLTIRLAVDADQDAVRELAVLDSRPVPEGPVLVAEVGDQLWAAVSLEDGQAMGDPFRPTASLVTLLAQRADQLERAHRWPRSGRPGRLRRLLPGRA